MKVYSYLHTHWDLEWYRNKEDFDIRLIEVLDVVLDELLNNRAPFFYLDGQTIALLTYLKYREEKKEIIKKLIEEKKLAIGPFFVSADSYLVDFNSMLKNLDIGLEISKKFNQKDFIGYMADIFGISNSIFEALSIKNIDKALIWRGINPDKIKSNCDFIKNNINTTWLVQGYFNDFIHSKDDIKIIAANIKNYLDKIKKYSNLSCLLPIGADHLGILRNATEKIKEINNYLDDYEIILTNPFEYFKNNQFANKIKEKEFLDNSNTYILNGVYSSGIDLKIKNNYLENKLSRIIEPLNYYLKDNFEKNILEGYKILISNHAHDGICACSLDSVYRANIFRYEQVYNIQEAILKKLIGNFKKKHGIKGKSKDKIGLFNLSNYDDIKSIELTLPYKLENSQIIKVERKFKDDDLYDIYKIPVTEEITEHYTQLVEIEKNSKFSFNTIKIKKPKKLTKISLNSLENDFIKVFIKNEKVTIENKINSQKIKLYLKDTLDEGDSYNFAPNKETNYEVIKTKIIENGLIRSILRIYFKNNIYLDLIMENHSKILKFKYFINNKKKNHKIQLCFVLKNKIYKTFSDDAIGIIKRDFDPDYNIKNFMPAIRPFELKNNIRPMQNFVNVDKFSIMTKGLNEYEIYKNEIRICLLRCFDTISNPKNKVRAIPAGPNLETKESQNLKLNVGNLGILFEDYKETFQYLDEFKKNYVTISGEFKQDLNIVLDSFRDYFYCINNNKKILYNIKKDEINVI